MSAVSAPATTTAANPGRQPHAWAIAPAAALPAAAPRPMAVIGHAKASVIAPAGATSPTSWLAAAM
jgi:hypothetical protein